jgi:hypothetical protein
LFGRASHARSPAPSGFLNLLTLSSAPNLLALFHARSALGVFPSELSSSRTAVHRLRRRCPPAVRIPSSRSESRRALHKRRGATEGHEAPQLDQVPGNPSSSGLSSMRESATSGKRFRPAWARSSLGLLPFRVLSLAERVAAFTALPLMRLPVRETNRPNEPSSGSCYPASWLVSLETADPLGVRHLLTVHGSSIWLRSGSRLLRLRGTSPSPGRALFEPSCLLYRSLP